MGDTLPIPRPTRRKQDAYMALARKSKLSNGQAHGTLDDEARALFGRLLVEGRSAQAPAAAQPRAATPTSEPATTQTPHPKRFFDLLVAFGVGAIAANLLQR